MRKSYASEEISTGGYRMSTSIHSGGEIGKTLLWIIGIVAFVIIALTKVPDWISPEGTNGTGNGPDPGVGRTVKMIQ
jgi:hypothetical protein